MNLIAYLRTQWDRAGAVAAVVIGAIVLLLGYLGTRDAVLVEQQMPYVVSGGLLGIFLLALGGVLWLSADLRDDWREVKDLSAQVARLADGEDRRLLAEQAAADAEPVAQPQPSFQPELERTLPPVAPLAPVKAARRTVRARAAE